MITVVAMLLWALIPGFMAQKKGRSFIGYYLLSLLISPLITIIIVACLKNLNQTPPPPNSYDPNTQYSGDGYEPNAGGNADEQSTQPSAKFCSNCGEKVTGLYCSRCGQRIQ